MAQVNHRRLHGVDQIVEIKDSLYLGTSEHQHDVAPPDIVKLY